MIGIYGDDERLLNRFTHFAVNVRSLPIILLGPNVSVLRRVASTFKIKCRKFDPREIEIDSLVDTSGSSEILEIVVRDCENVNYIACSHSMELESVALKYASEAKRKKILISIGSDLHSTATESSLENASNRLKVKSSKWSNIQFGVHYQFHRNASLYECLGEASSTILTILDGAKRSLRIENTKRSIPRSIDSIISSNTQKQSYVTHFIPILRSVQRDNKNSEKKMSFVISLEKTSPWLILAVFSCLSSWIFIFLVSNFECIHCALKKFVIRCRDSQSNVSSHALVWCHVEMMKSTKREASYILDITSPSNFDVKCAVRIAENMLYRLPRRLAGSGALVMKRSGWRTHSTAFGSDFASRLDSVNVVDDGWRGG